MVKPQKKPAYNPFAELETIRDERTGHPDSQAPSRLGTQVTPTAKSQDPSYVKLTAYIPKHIHRAVKSRLVEQDKEISVLVNELLTEWLRAERLPT